MNVLLLLPQNTGVDLNLLPCFLGYNLYVLGNKVQPAISYSRFCKYMHASVIDEEVLNDICVSNNIDIVIPSDMKSVYLLSNLKNTINTKTFPVSSVLILKSLDNKKLFNDILSELQLPTPKTILIDTIYDLDSKELEYPVVAKPLQESGLRGVKKCDSKQDLSYHLQSKDKYNQLPILTQKYIEGYDLDVSVISFEGNIVGYSIQRWLENGTLKFVKNDRALGYVKKIVSSLSYSGVAHFDMRVSSETDQIFILECNPRFWGSVGGSYWAGVNFVEIGIQLAFRKLPNSVGNYSLTTYTGITTVLDKIKKLHLKYISWITMKNILFILSDPLPFLVTLKEKSS